MGPKEKKQGADHLGFQAKEVLTNVQTSSTAPQGKKPDRNQRIGAMVDHKIAYCDLLSY